MVNQTALEDLLRMASESSAGVLSSTYRIQLDATFDFDAAAEVVPYLSEIGVSHLYLSPIWKAAAGSTHGYNVVDHGLINPELGGEAALDRLLNVLCHHGIGLLLDVVPNHASVGTNENLWWNDVLEHGRFSDYAGFFDIRWNSDVHKNKVILPILTDTLEPELLRGKLSITGTPASPKLCYGERVLPVRISSLSLIAGQPSSFWRKYYLTLRNLREFEVNLLESSDSITSTERATYGALLINAHEELQICYEADPQYWVDRMAKLNDGSAESKTDIRVFVNSQNFQLVWWRTESTRLNYRRFFDVTDLAGLSVEKPIVFEAVHRRLFDLVAAHRCGVRIDHIDGLTDPKRYLEQLQRNYLIARARYLSNTIPDFANCDVGLASSKLLSVYAEKKPLFCVTEKILAEREALSAGWSAHGTTGYERIIEVNGLFVERGNEALLTKVYDDFTKSHETWHEVALESKKTVQTTLFAEELTALDAIAHRLSVLLSRRLERNHLRDAICVVTSHFDVYRTYIQKPYFITETDACVIEKVFQVSTSNAPPDLTESLTFLQELITNHFQMAPGSVEIGLTDEFVRRLQQFTAPVMAKGVEDTAFYRYNRLLSLNEVGANPGTFGSSISDFHRRQEAFQDTDPLSLFPLSTHDTKRSEDLRARLNVLSEIPEKWGQRLRQWRALNEKFKTGSYPSPNEEYFLYQSIVGGWPLDIESSNDFISRLQNYIEKSLREAREHTFWQFPHHQYETEMRNFIGSILSDGNRVFLHDIKAFIAEINSCGLLNSLSQTVLRYSLPGIPDTYQGTELWNFNFVDPDNRRHVDFPLRMALLKSVSKDRATFDECILNLSTGKAKLLLVSILGNMRRQHPDLFTNGSYIALAAEGSRSRHVIAFLREYGGKKLLVAATRFFVQLLNGQSRYTDVGWEDTQLIGGHALSASWRNLIDGSSMVTHGKLDVADILQTRPFALLISTK